MWSKAADDEHAVSRIEFSFKHEVILWFMGSTPTKGTIENRIIALVDAFTRPSGDSDLQGTSKRLFDAVCDQGVVSSRGGKRLRALLAIAVWQAAHDTDQDDVSQAMLNLACAIEIFQTGALVHDDIIDESDLRRGRPSAHRALSDIAHDESIGSGLGLMLGDVLATCSIDVATNAAGDLDNPTAIVRAFLAMQREVEIGQVLDLAVELAPLSRPLDLIDASLKVFRWKTASYTTIAPVRLALLASGMQPNTALANAERIGAPLGIAFQLGDDLLDVIGSSTHTGKPVGGDIREGKRTVLLADALQLANTADRRALIEIFSQSRRGPDAVRNAIGLFHSTGAIDRSRQRIADLWQETQQAIRQTPLSSKGQAIVEHACAAFIVAPSSTDEPRRA